MITFNLVEQTTTVVQPWESAEAFKVHFQTMVDCALMEIKMFGRITTPPAMTFHEPEKYAHRPTVPAGFGR